MSLLFKSLTSFLLLSLALNSDASDCGHLPTIDLGGKQFKQSATFAIGSLGKAYGEEQFRLVMLDQEIKLSLIQQATVISCLAYNQMNRGEMAIAFAEDGSFQFRRIKLEKKFVDGKTIIAKK